MDSFDYEYDGEVPRFWFSSRFAMALLGFVGFLSMSSQRMCITVAMNCMLNHTALQLLQQQKQSNQMSSHEMYQMHHVDNVTETTTFTPHNTSVGLPISSDVTAKTCGGIPTKFVINPLQFHYQMGEFVWPDTTQEAIMNAFYWGYVVTQVPSGWLAQRYGGKRVFGFLLLASSLSTALIPAAARTHLFLLLALRFIGGIGAGATFPAMHTLWGKWAPPQERSLLASITYAGSLTGSVVIFPIAGFLCEYGIDGKGFDGGWPAIFYIFGALGVVWFILWMICASESPSEHGRINALERQYIIETIMTETVHTTSAAGQQKMRPVPWAKALTSFPFIAIVLCNFTYEWGIYTFEKLFPVFQKTVLKIDIPLNSIFALSPYLGLWMVVMASGGGADRLQSHGVLSTTATRKVMQLIGALVPACMVAATGFIDCSQWRGTISFMTIGLSFCGFQYNGFLVNHLDIAPPFAGILMGIANAIGSTASFWLPYFLGIIMSTSEDINEQWQTVFLITSALYVFSTAFYLLCGSGQIQSWALEPTTETPTLPTTPPLTSSLLRPNSMVASSPSTGQSPTIYGIKPQSAGETYSTDTIRRSQQQNQTPALNHTPTAATTYNNASSGGLAVNALDDSDPLNRKLSNKSTTSSKTKEEPSGHVTVRRTDHDRDRDYHRPRSGHRDSRDAVPAKDSLSKRKDTPRSRIPDDSLDIYESLSESPV